jgi:peptide/nickel transport system permease protein
VAEAVSNGPPSSAVPPTSHGTAPREPSGLALLVETYHVLRANLLTFVGAVLTAVMAVVALVVEFLPPVSRLLGHPATILPYDPNGTSAALLVAPNAQHWFGTDELGRDMFSRVLAALPLDLGVATFIILASVLIGGALGLVAGYWDEPKGAGRYVSVVILRVTDVFLAFPTLIFALALAALFGRTLTSTIIALIATWWPYYVRLVRGEVLTIKHQGYIAAARAVGVSERRIVFRHVLRNLLEPVIVYLTLDIGTVIVTFSTIAYVGIAIPASTPEWGSMIAYYQGFLPSYLWLVLGPGAAIFVSVLALSLLGDGLRDVLDPRARRAFARVSRDSAAPISTTPEAPGEA